MKDKYFGDVHDFLKYALLRVFQKEMNWSIFINWMRTTYEPKRNYNGKTQIDGEKIQYGKLQSIDTKLYNALVPYCLGQERRQISAFKNLKLLHNYGEYEVTVPDGSMHGNLLEMRKQWREKFYTLSKGFNLVFFDPDNGLQVESTSERRNNSYKYVFKDEIKQVFNRGQNVLIYQHRDRQNYCAQVEEKVKKLKDIAHDSHIIVFNGKGTFFSFNGRFRNSRRKP